MAVTVVKTKYGIVQGLEFDGKYTGISIFRGIPYAKPPIRNLRWRPPEDPEPWQGVRRCTKFTPIAYQDYGNYKEKDMEEFFYNPLPEMSEDCLYLNVCTGALEAGENRPVYIWFHGGGLEYGNHQEIEFNPQELARKGIVVVLVSQRLNLFGYLALPQLTAEQGEKSGNYGLMDQFKALDWVCDNIEGFGGDPDNITIGGQSGGAQKSCVMVGTTRNCGRIKRVICESGLKWLQKFPSLEDAEKVGVEYLKHIGVDPYTSVEKLRALPSSEIFKMGVERAFMPGEMVRDGDWIRFSTIRECYEAYLGDVDFLYGVNLGEAKVFKTLENSANKSRNRPPISMISNKRDFYEHFSNLLGDLYTEYDFENLVKVNDNNAWDTARRLASFGLAPNVKPNFSRSLMIDRIFGDKMHSKHSNSGYYTYLWSHLLPFLPEDIGTQYDSRVSLAWHASELWFTFSSLRKENHPPKRIWRESDFELADIVSSYWANFISKGNPNGDGLAYWPTAYEGLGYLEIAGGSIVSHQGINQLDKLVYEFTVKEYALKDESAK